MSKANRVVEKCDLISLNDYAKNRKQFRKKLFEFKKKRRISIGPYATFYFESFETMLGQIQEMLHIEKGGEEQLKDEFSAYNPLIPKGRELVATLMFEIDNLQVSVPFQSDVKDSNIFPGIISTVILISFIIIIAFSLRGSISNKFMKKNSE